MSNLTLNQTIIVRSFNFSRENRANNQVWIQIALALKVTAYGPNFEKLTKGLGKELRNALRAEVKSKSHQTLWNEIKRQWNQNHVDPKKSKHVLPLAQVARFTGFETAA